MFSELVFGRAIRLLNGMESLNIEPSARNARCGMILSEAPKSDQVFFSTESVGGEFGVTAVLRPYSSIVDYMEKKAMPSTGYFRLVRHPYVRELESRLCAGTDWPHALVFVSAEAAQRELADFFLVTDEIDDRSVLLETLVSKSSVPQHADANALICPLPSHKGIQGGVVFFQEQALVDAVWDRVRKRGSTLSARNAAWYLGHEVVLPSDGVTQHVADRLCQLEAAQACFLYPTGMAAVVHALKPFITEDRSQVLVVGHVYSDTHVILDEIPWGNASVDAHFFSVHQLDDFEAILHAQTACVMVETVTNPQCEIPDLPRIIAAAKKFGVPVVVDNTMATPLNCQPLDLGADVSLHSTTKYFSGCNSHGGGAILVSNPDLADRYTAQQARWQNQMSPLEAAVLLSCLNTFEERMERFNRNGELVADFLRNHPAVKTVFSPDYKSFSHMKGGGGSVLSFLLKDSSLEALIEFYDELQPPILCAPSLGSDVTLLCPYVLLTYYQRDEAYMAELGLNRHLLRLSVGSEIDINPVIECLDLGLQNL